MRIEDRMMVLIFEAFIEALNYQNSPSIFMNNRFKLNMYPLYQKQIWRWLLTMKKLLEYEMGWGEKYVSPVIVTAGRARNLPLEAFLIGIYRWSPHRKCYGYIY
jgi:hypothetical protein